MWLFLPILALSENIPKWEGSPGPRQGSILAYDSISNSLFLFGGFNGFFLNDLWRFDFASQVWANLTNLSPYSPGTYYLVQNANGIGWVSNSDIYIFGGQTSQGLNSEMWKYSSSKKTVKFT